MGVRLTIIGAAGQMGQRLIALAHEDEALTVVGAVEHAESPALGTDSGLLASGTANGIPITSCLVEALKSSDVVIDFSSPDQAVENAMKTTEEGVGFVLGTTGLTPDQQAELKWVALAGGRVVAAPNMSVGVNLLFQLAGQVARTLGLDYNVEIVEMHHNRKQDAPSGTAERLGQVVCEALGLDYAEDTEHGRVGIVGARERGKIGMHALRGGDVVGDHQVIFATGGERIELIHRASTRDTFARGALRAAKFLHDAAPGLYDMPAVLGLGDDAAV